MRAMILAAGRGERMRPLTDTCPKPLVTAGGRPLIEWHIERLVRAGMADIIINHAWLGEQIEERLGDGSRLGARLRYSPEPLPLETAGGIAQVLDFFEDAPFLVMNGDVWCDWDPRHALEAARRLEQGPELAWLLLAPNPAHHPQGDFGLVPGSLQLRPRDAPGAVGATFSGLGVYKPALFSGLTKGIPAKSGPLLHAAISRGLVLGSLHPGYWQDVGTIQRLRELNDYLERRAGSR